MREIKFRAWDKESREYLPNVQNHIGNEESAFGFMLKNDRYILEQFTGLLAKNGKEIYEGDIVKHKKTNGLPHQGRVRIMPTQGVMVGAWPICFALEIIGNIHENPELLK